MPLLFIAISLVSTDFFATRTPLVDMVATFSSTFLSQFRDTFGTLLVPMVTAYSVPIRAQGEPVPRQTLILFFVLIAIFVLTVALYAGVTYNLDKLAKFNEWKDDKLIKDVSGTYLNTITSYGKESLAYIALLLGLTLKKQTK